MVLILLLDEVYKSDELKERYVIGLKDILAFTDIFFQYMPYF